MSLERRPESPGGVTIQESIQVAGIADEREARMLIGCGVDFLGFPVNVPVHREDVAESEVAGIIAAIGLPKRVVLITYLDRSEEIGALCRRTGARIVQLHGDIEKRELVRLKAAQPGLHVIKSLIVGEPGRPDPSRQVAEFAAHVDAFIADTFDPSTGARGATGRTHDWRQSRVAVECSPRPVILAGGLTPGNVGRAIREVRPSGVDVHTGVEDAAGRKDEDLVRTFVSAAREAFAEVSATKGKGREDQR
jgi:phosphoribosylanthranilate isomerase